MCALCLPLMSDVEGYICKVNGNSKKDIIPNTIIFSLYIPQCVSVSTDYTEVNATSNDAMLASWVIFICEIYAR